MTASHKPLQYLIDPDKMKCIVTSVSTVWGAAEWAEPFKSAAHPLGCSRAYETQCRGSNTEFEYEYQTRARRVPTGPAHSADPYATTGALLLENEQKRTQITQK